MKKVKISKGEKKAFVSVVILFIAVILVSAVMMGRGNKDIEKDLVALVDPIDLDYRINDLSFQKTCSTAAVNALLLSYGLDRVQCTQNPAQTNWAVDIADGADVYCIDSLEKKISRGGRSVNGVCPQ